MIFVHCWVFLEELSLCAGIICLVESLGDKVTRVDLQPKLLVVGFSLQQSMKNHSEVNLTKFTAVRTEFSFTPLAFEMYVPQIWSRSQECKGRFSCLWYFSLRSSSAHPCCSCGPLCEGNSIRFYLVSNWLICTLRMVVHPFPVLRSFTSSAHRTENLSAEKLVQDNSKGNCGEPRFDTRTTLICFDGAELDFRSWLQVQKGNPEKPGLMLHRCRKLTVRNCFDCANKKNSLEYHRGDVVFAAGLRSFKILTRRKKVHHIAVDSESACEAQDKNSG